MNIIKRVFDTRGSAILIPLFTTFFILERKRQLRKRVQPSLKRVTINSAVAIPAFGLLRLLFLPLMVKLAYKNQQLQFGLNYQYSASPLVKTIVTYLLLDYGNYLWHLMNHKFPLLWRFHLVHHSDPDLDVTTAIRFHFGELIGSVFSRGAFVFLSGASPIHVITYEIAFEAATQFHHSNINVPFSIEKLLNKVIVTPRMHGIHHSVVRQETDSNYSVIFSFWDRLHNTIRLNVPQHLIVTGVPNYSNHNELTIEYLLKLPFTKIRKWEVHGLSEEQRSIGSRNRLAE